MMMLSKDLWEVKGRATNLLFLLLESSSRLTFSWLVHQNFLLLIPFLLHFLYLFQLLT